MQPQLGVRIQLVVLREAGDAGRADARRRSGVLERLNYGTVDIRSAGAAFFVRKAAGIAKGSGVPNRDKVGKVTRAQLEDIAKLKAPDMTAASLEAGVRTIAGSARSMGVDVEG